MLLNTNLFLMEEVQRDILKAGNLPGTIGHPTSVTRATPPQLDVFDIYVLNFEGHM